MCTRALCRYPFVKNRIAHMSKYAAKRQKRLSLHGVGSPQGVSRPEKTKRGSKIADAFRHAHGWVGWRLSYADVAPGAIYAPFPDAPAAKPGRQHLKPKKSAASKCATSSKAPAACVVLYFPFPPPFLLFEAMV